MARSRSGLMASLLLVAVLCGMGLFLQTDISSAVTKPGAVKLISVQHSGSTLNVRWEQNPEATGYQVQYAKNRIFMKKKSIAISKGSVTSRQIKGVSASSTYYVRVRALHTDKSGTGYSPWTLSPNAKKDKTISKKKIRKNVLQKLELRRAAKQKVPGYDTLQGCCYGGGYVYYLLENRNISYSGGRCKIVKMKLSNKKVVKVSSPLALSHGNDMTYDSKRKRLVVAHSTPIPKAITTVSAKTLRVKSTRFVELPQNLYKLPHPKKNPNKYINNYNGFGAIAYNAKHDQFVALLRGSNFHHLLIMNKNFKPVRFEYVDERPSQTVQGMDSYGDYVMVSESYSSGKPNNHILVYDWNEGDLMSVLNLGSKYELESIFHTGSKVYAGYYTSFYKYKKLTRTYALQRDNYLFELSGF